ncbi:MAG: hypothetical protein HRT44_13295, partial [Bdellovibrionales bacterium]|nr:hypothetical protein [Bdellovibrionales bacterium]
MKIFIGFLVLALVSTNSAFAIEVHGHRGSRGTHPENTLPAFAEALAAGVDVLELDLGMTKDNVLILAHDPEVNNQICKNMNGKPLENGIVIRNTNLYELKKIDCGGLKNSRFPEQKPIA